MKTRYVLATAATAALLLATAAPALAQQTTSETAAAKAPSGRLEKYHDSFRASDLVGATVYDDQGNSVGKINDLLLGADGKAGRAVVSVGGFLGLGTKYVDVAFDQLKIEPSRDTPAAPKTAGGTTPTESSSSAAMPLASNGTADAPARATGTPTATAPGATGMTATTTPATSAGSAADMSSNTQYYSLVMPGVTKDSLTAMPEFKYAG